jgi:hypothetical protein
LKNNAVPREAFHEDPGLIRTLPDPVSRDVALIAALMPVVARSVAHAGSGPAVKTESFGFYMWCLEMQLYPAARCDARRSEDVKEYERYRADVEQCEKQRAIGEKRDQEVMDKLNRDPLERRAGPICSALGRSEFYAGRLIAVDKRWQETSISAR